MDGRRVHVGRRGNRVIPWLDQRDRIHQTCQRQLCTREVLEGISKRQRLCDPRSVLLLAFWREQFGQHSRLAGVLGCVCEEGVEPARRFPEEVQHLCKELLSRDSAGEPPVLLVHWFDHNNALRLELVQGKHGLDLLLVVVRVDCECIPHVVRERGPHEIKLQVHCLSVVVHRGETSFVLQLNGVDAMPQVRPWRDLGLALGNNAHRVGRRRDALCRHNIWKQVPEIWFPQVESLFKTILSLVIANPSL
mmetsp:Transcript_20758/g.48504  ORF Transcript_20758/g.48504 Transcript_20758/m.48504 type:complete len:249 (-) Transcript_20758:4103-4849(-)